jgi:hypothetical protein
MKKLIDCTAVRWLVSSGAGEAFMLFAIASPRAWKGVYRKPELSPANSSKSKNAIFRIKLERQP